MPEWIWVLDEDSNWESAVQRSQLPHGNYKVLKDPAPLTKLGEPYPPRPADTELDDPEFDHAAPEAAAAAAHVEDPGNQPEPSPYDDFLVADLEDEVDRRNAGRPEEEQIPSSGNKPDLIAALEADDEKE